MPELERLQVDKLGRKPRFLTVSPYPLGGGPNGVDNHISSLSPYLEEYFVVRTAGPIKRNEERNSADYKIGHAWRFTGRQTQADMGFTLNFKRARLMQQAIKPDIVLLHEPLAGNSAHTIIRAAPRREEDGKTCSAFIGMFHSRSEKLDFMTRFGLALARYGRLIEFNKLGIPKRLTPGVMNTVMGELDGMIAASKASGKHWNEIFGGEYKVIPNPINTDKLTPEGPKYEKWASEEGPILMCAARHDVRKRIDVAIRAMSKILEKYPTAKLKILGKGSETERLIELTKNLGLENNVNFEGIIEEFDDLVKAYRTCDVFLATSDRGEGWGRTGPEAKACGAELSITDIDGHREAVAGLSYVWKVEPGNPDCLAQSVLEILAIPKEERRLHGRIDYEKIKELYSCQRIAKETRDYSIECLEKHGTTDRSEWPKKERKKTYFMLPEIMYPIYPVLPISELKEE